VIHVVETDRRQWVRRIAFRDLLRRDADARAEYLQTKRATEAQTSDWNAYTQAKTATVHRLLRAIPA
jgi:dephospho-CoA kinase